MSLINPERILVLGAGLGKSMLKQLLVEAGYATIMKDGCYLINNPCKVDIKELLIRGGITGGGYNIIWNDPLNNQSFEDYEPEHKYFTPKRREMPSLLFSRMLENIEEK